MFEGMVLLLLFLITATLVFAIYLWFAQRAEAAQQRLQLEEELDLDVGQEKQTMLLGSLTPALAQTPMSAAGESALKKELREAGFYRPNAILEFRALRTIFILVPIFGSMILTLFLENDKTFPILGLGFLGAILGFSLPRLYIQYLAKKRSREIERGLPVAVDLVTLSLTGGSSIYHALGRVGQELEPSFPILAQELKIVHRQAELGNLNLAMDHFAERTSVQEVRNLALVLSQSERLGTDITNALLEFSNNFRVNIRQRAEAQANRASFWMLFPTVLCLWIPAAIILLGPVYYEFLRKRVETRDMLRKDRTIFEKSSNNDNLFTPPLTPGPGAESGVPSLPEGSSKSEGSPK